MATRFYFPITTAAAIGISPAIDAGWEQSVALIRRAAMTYASTYENGTGNCAGLFGSTLTSDSCYGQWISRPLDKNQTISGTVSMVVPCAEGTTAEHAHLAFVLRVLSGDGSMVRGTLGSVLTTSTEFVAPAGAPTTRFHDSVALSPLACLEGDRLVMELGVHGVTPANLSTIVLACPPASDRTDYDIGADFPLGQNPWWELSQDVYLRVNRPLPLAPTQRC